MSSALAVTVVCHSARSVGTSIASSVTINWSPCLRNDPDNNRPTRSSCPTFFGSRSSATYFRVTDDGRTSSDREYVSVLVNSSASANRK